MANKKQKTPLNDFYGRLTWSNFVDWLVTLCVGAILMSTVAFLGGVRPDTMLLILPLFSILLVLHGIWLAVDNSEPKRVSHVPFLFLPFLIWVFVSAGWLSETQWLGEYEFIAALLAFVLLWVLTNNLHTWSQAASLFVMLLAPVGYGVVIGFYQFFQDPTQIADTMTDSRVVLSPEFYGKATGVFADPNSFAVLLLIILPAVIIAAGVSRLPVILKLFCYYTGLMIFLSLLFAQCLWALTVLVPIGLSVAWFTSRLVVSRIWRGLLFVGLTALCCFGGAKLHPRVEASFEKALQPEGELVRTTLWAEAGRIFVDSPIAGVGAGGFARAFEHSAQTSLPASPQTPQNDYLLLLSEYGIIGGLLLLGPIAWLCVVCYRAWAGMPFKVTSEYVDGKFMPMSKLSLAISMGSVIATAFAAMFSFLFCVPALLLAAVFFFSQMVKSGQRRLVHIPDGKLFRWGYIAASVVAALLLYAYAQPRLESHAVELNASGRLDQIVAKRVHLSGRDQLLDQVIEEYRYALELNPVNVDALLGLSAAQCQLYYRDPSTSAQVGTVASEYAAKAIELSGDYWKAWAQFGIAKALSGDLGEAEEALRRALDLAPNNSDANYFWAAFNSGLGHLSVSLDAVNRALEINPENEPARRLQQKLLIL